MSRYGGNLVEKVEVGVPGECRGQRDPLEFTAREGVDVLVDHRADREPVDQLREGTALVGPLEQGAGRPVELAGDLVDVLWLAGDGHVAVPHRLEIVLEGSPAVLLEYVGPVGFVTDAAEVGVEFAGEDTDGGGLSDPVGAENPRHLALLGGREAVEAERVLAVAVNRLVVQLLREIDDLDGVEGALLDADATGFAEADLLGDPHLVGGAGVGVVGLVTLLAGDNTLLARPVWRAEVDTLVVTAVGLTLSRSTTAILSSAIVTAWRRRSGAGPR
jgi:hypothetical protein